MPWEASAPRRVSVRMPNGDVEEVDESAPFAETIQQILRRRAIATALVYVRRVGEVDVRPVEPGDAPATFQGLEEVEIRQYLKAG